MVGLGRSFTIDFHLRKINFITTYGKTHSCQTVSRIRKIRLMKKEEKRTKIN